MYEKLTTKTLVLYEIYFLYETRVFKYYFHTLYEKSTTHYIIFEIGETLFGEITSKYIQKQIIKLKSFI
jgi:hypothetical protein